MINTNQTDTTMKFNTYTYTVTNTDTFDKMDVLDVDTSGITDYNARTGAFTGVIAIEFVNAPEKVVTGEHGASDYEDEYGFRLEFIDIESVSRLAGAYDTEQCEAIIKGAGETIETMELYNSGGHCMWAIFRTDVTTWIHFRDTSGELFRFNATPEIQAMNLYEIVEHYMTEVADKEA